MSQDPHAHDAAAYVLGALSPVQRRAFEEHLVGCDSCSRAVNELAGIPGLLAGLDERSYLDPADVPPVPETLLPQLLREVRRQRRRTRALVLAGVAAAVVLVAVLAGIALRGRPASTPSVAPVRPAQEMTQEMTQVDQDRLTAQLSLQPVAWGTRLHLSCRYADSWVQPGVSYALVVHTHDGAAQQVATWRALPQRTAVLDAATDADLDEITAVDVVITGTDHTLLTLAAPHPPA